MKIFYLSQRDVRKNRADCVHIMKTCVSFNNNGYKVNLVTPYVFRREYRVKKNNIWELYNIEDNLFGIIELPTISWDDMGVKSSFLLLFFKLQLTLYTFLYFLFLSVFRRIKKEDIIYSKSYAMNYSIILLRKFHILKNKLFLEKAEFEERNSVHLKICRNVDGIIAINNYIREHTINDFKIEPQKVFKLNFTSQYEDFKDISKDKDATRKMQGMNKYDRVIMYAGKISPNMKEIYYILESAKQLTDLSFFFIGAKSKSKKHFEDYSKFNCIENSRFIEFLPISDFFSYLVCADILLSYYDSFDTLSVTQRVPAKSSLYLLAERPIIMADLPGLREWWNDEEIYFVRPDDSTELSKTILHILNNPREASMKVQKCSEFARKNTYFSAYKTIIEGIHNISK